MNPALTPAQQPPHISRRGAIALGGGAVVGAAAGLPGLVLPASAAGAATLDRSFDESADKHGIPRDLLAAVGYTETRLDGHDGKPSNDNGYGIMHLVLNPQHTTLSQAGKLTGRSARELKNDSAANIDGAAAVLRAYADDAGMSAGSRKNIDAWFPVVARYSGANKFVASLYADAVYSTLALGASANGVIVDGRPIDPDRGRHEIDGPVGILSTDYPPAHWVAAHSSNYTGANRPSSNPINYVIIHVTQGSYAGTISWFQNPSSNVSTQYVIRSSDGDVTQMVRDHNIAWHAGNWTYNQQSIGTEHEGFVDNPSWFTEAMYQSSAALTKHVCDEYGIPKTRSRIIGHNEVPGATHTDPGPHWDWAHYMDLVTGGGGDVTWQTTIDNVNAGFTAGDSWGMSSWNSQKFGANYRFNNPEPISDAAWYSANLPSSSNYRVEVWYSADSGYNTAAPYVVVTRSGNQSVHVDQRSGGGRWRNIGTFPMAAGNHNVVAVSRWTNGTGIIIADAVRISRIE